MLVIYFVCTVDLIQSCFRRGFPFVENFLRPVIVLIILSQIRSNMKGILFDIKDSAVVMICIFSYVAFFSIVGFFMFRSSFAGHAIYTSPTESMYQMMILLTTANYPDIMLPSYNSHRVYVLYFMGYLIIGLYFLQNILLAIVFDNYKKRITQKVEDKTESRVSYIVKYFEMFDLDNDGILNLLEAKKFFSIVLDLNYKKPSDRVTFRKIMKVLDVDDQRIIYKVNVIQFFSLPNFLNVVVANEVATDHAVVRSDSSSDELALKGVRLGVSDFNTTRTFSRGEGLADEYSKLNNSDEDEQPPEPTERT